MGVESTGHGQAAALDALFLEARLGFLHSGGGARDHRLPRGIAIGHHHVQSPGGQHGLQGFGGGHHGTHGAIDGSGLVHQLAAAPCSAQQLHGAKGPRSAQGRKLAETMPGHTGGLHAECVQQGKLACAHHPDGRLGPLGRRESGLQCLAFFIAEHRNGKDHLIEAQTIPAQGGGLVPHRPGGIELHGEFCPHLQVLTALAGEQEGQLAGHGTRAIEPALG